MDSSALRLNILFHIRSGQGTAFRRLAEELTADTQAGEPRTLSYEWYMNSDGTECWICERYVDSAALREHHDHVSERVKILAQLADIKMFLLLGSPTPELRNIYELQGAQVLECFSGFCR